MHPKHSGLITTIVGLIFLHTQLPLVNSAQILGLFAHPGKSHFDFFRPILHGLAAKGHNVTVVSYFPSKTPIDNYTDLALSGMPIFADIVDIQAFEELINKPELVPFKIPTFFMLHDWGMDSCKIAFNSEAIKTVLSSNIKYDVVILEQFNNDCMMAIAHLLKAPVIALSSCAIMPWHYQRMGSPFIASHMPMNFLPHTEEMNFFERLNNFIHFQAVNVLYNVVTQRATNALIKQHYGAGMPAIEDLIKNTSLMLINQHYSLNGAYPYAPNIVEVGGLQIQAEKPLEQHLKELLNNSPKGVIYFSWGSMIRTETLSKDKLDALLKTVAQFPEQLFVMKWPNVTLTNKPKNLRTFSWLPQRDLLCHRNVKAFIAHGGLLGVTEAVHCGVPLLVTPFYGDQFLNSKAIEKRKIGVIVTYSDFNVHNLVNGLRTILTPSFAHNAKLVSESFRNRPEAALDLALRWVEHVIQIGGAPLAQSSSRHLNWLIYHSIDIYLFIALFVLLVVIIVSLIVKAIFTLCSKFKSKKRKVKKQ